MTVFIPQLPRPGAFEETHSIVNAWFKAQLALYAEALRTLWSPWECPADMLDELAWAWSVDFWREWWPEFRKRQVIAESRAFHRLKSTIAADRMACRYADAELISYHLPRDGFAVAEDVSPEAYQAWIGGLPEIRIWPLPPRPAVWEPLGGALGEDPAYVAEEPLVEARYAELVRGDRAIPLVVSGETYGPDGEALDEIERVSVPMEPLETAGVDTFAFGDVPLGANPVSRRVFSFRWRPASRDPFDLVPGVPSLVPVEARPRRVPILRPYEDHLLVVGDAPMESALDFEPGREDYYLALKVADGTGPSGPEPGPGAVGVDRLARAPYTKELSILISRPPSEAFPFTGWELAADPQPIVDDLLEAVASAQGFRDEVTVDLNVLRPLKVADLATVTATTKIGEYRLMTRR
ncbi:MAG: phage tail protein I [Rhizobiaceae bacterium]|nr:phage tail protein I [Rhizobiaceae bacterium]